MNTEILIDKIIDLAFQEDGPDATSTAVFDMNDRLRAVLKAKEKGIIAGLGIAENVFRKLDPDVLFFAKIRDGEEVQHGTIIALVEGKARAILKAERVALNFMQRMSGIATMTSAYVMKIEGTKARILDTRKTAPGNRILDKIAVRAGGGENHRMGLYDMALIKDNHIDRIGSITEAVKRVKEKDPELPVEVEARNLDDVMELLRLKVDRIMLDNFSLADMRKAVEVVSGQIPLEASGNITIDNIRDVALTGVDYISTGALTHSVKAFDISLLIERA